MSSKIKKLVVECLLVCFLAFVMALVYEVLIFPNSFAPAGINGLATIIQHKLNFEVGYMSLIINVPLLIVAFFTVSKEFTVKTTCYILVFSFFTLIIKNGNGDLEGIWDISNFTYKNTSISNLLAPLASGAINGIIYGYSVRKNSCTGGTDIIARLVRKKRPELNIMWLTFALNSVVAVISFFAYAENGVYNIEPVLLCFVYCFTSSKAGDTILKGYKTALKFEVVTSHPNEISAEIIQKLKHTATVVHAEGMFSHQSKELLICVVNKNQIVEFERIVKKYPETFAYLSTVSETMGNFVDASKKKKEAKKEGK